MIWQRSADTSLSGKVSLRFRVQPRVAAQEPAHQPKRPAEYVWRAQPLMCAVAPHAKAAPKPLQVRPACIKLITFKDRPGAVCRQSNIGMASCARWRSSSQESFSFIRIVNVFFEKRLGTGAHAERWTKLQTAS